MLWFLCNQLIMSKGLGPALRDAHSATSLTAEWQSRGQGKLGFHLLALREAMPSQGLCFLGPHIAIYKLTGLQVGLDT